MKIITFFLLLMFLFSVISHAQLRIVFEKTGNNFGLHTKGAYPITKSATFTFNDVTNTQRVYPLPTSVTCTFKDGTKQRLVLERINGDSLIFQKYYNQQQSFDCVYASLQKIKIHKKGEEILYVLFAGFTAAAIASAITAKYCLDNSYGEYGGYDLMYAEILWIPSTIVCSIGSLITITAFPKKYKPGKWKLYAK